MRTLILPRLRLLLLAATATALLGCTTAPSRPAAAVFGPAWQTVDCKTFAVPDSITPHADCGFVATPEQHAQAGNGRTIQLAVVRVRSLSPTPAPDPVFVEQGGPGDSTIGAFVQWALPGKSPGLLAWWAKRDLVFVEERGTRYSRPYLACPEIRAHNIAVARGERAYTDPAWIQACHARFLAQGVNPSAFNTQENASDMYFVAQALGYPQFNFYGGSYGTLLGQYVIAQSGRYGSRLRSAVIDGVVRPDIDFNLAFSHTLSHALRAVFRDCANDARCNQAYPALEQKFLAVVDDLNRNPRPVTLTVPSTKQAVPSRLDGAAFVDGLLMSLYRTTAQHGLPKNIHAASRGDLLWLVEPLSDSLESANAKEMYNTVLCARVRSVNVLPAQALPPAYPQLLPLGEREAQAVRVACDVLKVDQKPPFTNGNRDVPVLVFNGAYDPATPEPYGAHVASGFRNAAMFTFPGVGHIALILRPEMPAAACSARIASDFLDNPMRKPDGSCIQALRPGFQVD